MDYAIRRPVPRWLHVWAILSVVTTALLLIVGGFVTTFRVGMADPVWPTEPWYLASNYKFDFGYLVEHVHRILGWTVGLLGLVLTFGAWAYEPRSGIRRFGIGAIIALIFTFGAFHGVLRMAPKGEEGLPVHLNLVAMAVSLAVVLVAAYRTWSGGGTGGLIRALVVLGMVAAMIQGLLGGIRVRYNDLFGREMSAIHGSFAQIVFALLIAVAVLSGPVKREPPLPADVARKLRWQTLCLLLFTYAQIVWGAWIRHFPGPLSNRLHLFFAFVVVGFATLAIKQALVDPVSRQRFKVATRFLMGLITIQVLFGIEAWMGKFLTGTLPELETITAGKAFIRTAHAHIGTWVLGMAVIFYLIARRNPAEAVGPGSAGLLNLENTDSPTRTHHKDTEFTQRHKERAT
jgi:heme A synthase